MNQVEIEDNQPKASQFLNNLNLIQDKDQIESQIDMEDEDFDDVIGEFEDPKSAQADKASSGQHNSDNKEDDSNVVNADELQKIISIQSIRNRSNSMVSKSSHAPVLQPIKNFGHGRRSNLAQKVEQLKQRAQRSKSIVLGNLGAHQLFLRSQLLMNSSEYAQVRSKHNNHIIQMQSNFQF